MINRVFQALRERGSTAIPPATVTEIERLREEYGFFHWHLEFPGIFEVAKKTARRSGYWLVGWLLLRAGEPTVGQGGLEGEGIL